MPAHGPPWRDERGQAGILLVAVLLAVLVGAFVLGGIARGLGAHADQQRAADLAALAGAKAMHTAYPRLFEGDRGIDVAAYRALAVRVATAVARRNGADRAQVVFPDADAFAPVRIRVVVERAGEVRGERIRLRAVAEAELAPPASVGADLRGEYTGPLAHRQGKPMRPDVAQAFDRLQAAARADGVHLTIASAFRSNAEQAVLFARNPNPKWVAPPGTSLHRLGTELDLGPPAAYGWLARNAPRFGFKQRYSWAFGSIPSGHDAAAAPHSATPAAAAGAQPPWVSSSMRDQVDVDSQASSVIVLNRVVAPTARSRWHTGHLLGC